MFNKDNDLILIVGAGPAGLGSALAFHNNGFSNIIVTEARKDFNFDPNDSYPTDLNTRGQNSMKKLFNGSQGTSTIDNLGFKVSAFKVVVGTITVANIESGTAIASNRNKINLIVYEECQRRNIKVLFGYKAQSVDLQTKTVKFDSEEGAREFNPSVLVVADGVRSKIRDSLAEQDQTLLVQQWPWNMGFRSLFTDKEPITTLEPTVQYTYNNIFCAKMPDGRWNLVIGVTDELPKFLSSEEDSDGNVQKFKNYLKKTLPPFAACLTEQNYRNYFKSKIFRGAITKVSKLVVDDWAVLLGDAAHSPVPHTGEGINSSLEDCAILQDCLAIRNSFTDSFNEYDKRRLEDVHALSALAYSAAYGGAKNKFQMSVLSMMSKCGLIGPCKEDYLFGKHSAEMKPYSEVVKTWRRQTKFLFGATMPPCTT